MTITIGPYTINSNIENSNMQKLITNINVTNICMFMQTE